MFIVLIRTIFLYALVILVMRLMGKRQIGELQPYEFVITIMISDLAALPMQDTRLPLILGIIPIITLLFIKTVLTQLQLKSQSARKFLEGEPSILIRKGKINFKALKSQQINLDELMEELRLAGYFDLNEIEYGILENNGQMSFLTSSNSSQSQSSSSQGSNSQSGNSQNSSSQSDSSTSSSPPTNGGTSNTNIQGSNSQNKTQSTSSNQNPRLPVIYVVDGHVNKNSLTTSGKNKYWIEAELKKHGISSIKDVLLFMTDTNGKLVFQLYDDYEKRCSK